MYMYAVRKAVGKEDLSGECSMASFGTWAAVHARSLAKDGIAGNIVCQHRSPIDHLKVYGGCATGMGAPPVSVLCMLHDGNSRETWMHVGQPSITSQNADTLPPPWTHI